MEYFKHTYNGVEYDFKPNRVSQSRIQALQKESRVGNPEATKEMDKLAPRLEQLLKEVEDGKDRLKKAKTDDEKKKIEDEFKEKEQEVTELVIKVQEIRDKISNEATAEQIMYILLEEQRDTNYQKRYPDLNQETFENICFDIENKYGLEEYNMITSSIVSDVFTIGGVQKESQIKSEYLRNRANR